MQYAFLAIVLAGFVIGLGQAWFRRWREAPLRNEIRSQPITFWTRLHQVKVREGSGWPEWLGLNSAMALYVRGVLHPERDTARRVPLQRGRQPALEPPVARRAGTQC